MTAPNGEQQAAFTALREILPPEPAASWANRTEPFTLQEFCNTNWSAWPEPISTSAIERAIQAAGWQLEGRVYRRVAPAAPANDEMRASCAGFAPHPFTAPPVTAHTILQDAASAVIDRATQRDLPNGERSMARCVAAFNALTGHQLSEVDGWLFMAVLKASRATAGKHRLDDFTDGASYFALAGEAAQRQTERMDGAA